MIIRTFIDENSERQSHFYQLFGITRFISSHVLWWNSKYLMHQSTYSGGNILKSNSSLWGKSADMDHINWSLVFFFWITRVIVGWIDNSSMKQNDWKTRLLHGSYAKNDSPIKYIIYCATHKLKIFGGSTDMCNCSSNNANSCINENKSRKFSTAMLVSLLILRLIFSLIFNANIDEPNITNIIQNSYKSDRHTRNCQQMIQDRTTSNPFGTILSRWVETIDWPLKILSSIQRSAPSLVILMGGQTPSVFIYCYFRQTDMKQWKVLAADIAWP